MSGAFTSKNFPINKAPRRIELFGSKKRPESAQHIIEFPGGAIEVSRTTDCNYWAHIIVNQEYGREEGSLLQQARGIVEFSSLLRGSAVETGIEGAERLTQIAVLIKPTPDATPVTADSVRSQYAIIFPGGVLELNKTTDKGHTINLRITGEVIGSRIQRDGDFGVSDIDEEARLTNISMKVTPETAQRRTARSMPKAKAA